MISRRLFLKGAVLSTAALQLQSLQALTTTTAVSSKDEAYWQQLRTSYELPEGKIQLENGNWGVMSTPVLEGYIQHTIKVNRESSLYSRQHFAADYRQIRQLVARMLGAEPEEIAFSRGATEVLTNLITGYQPIGKGDSALYADTDYDSMQQAMDSLQQKGVKVIRIQLPERGTAQDYIASYQQALEQNPGIKLVLLTHLSHRHGQILPIAELVKLCKSYGADCIVDAAHSLGQINTNVTDIGADFIGFNLHKWIGAPLGVGVMYIRKNRLHNIAAATADYNAPADQIQAKIHTGTFNYAAWLTVPDALQFHNQIGAAQKAARLAYLREYWTEASRDIKKLQLLTLNSRTAAAGMQSFRLAGITDAEQNKKLAQLLLQDYGIFTVSRTGLALGACVRITPGIYTLTSELDQLVDALRRISQ